MAFGYDLHDKKCLSKSKLTKSRNKRLYLNAYGSEKAAEAHQDLGRELVLVIEPGCHPGQQRQQPRWKVCHQQVVRR